MNVFYIKYLFPSMLSSLAPVNTVISKETETQPGLSFTQELHQKLQSLSRTDILRMPLDFLLSYILLASWLQQALVTLFRGRKGYVATLQIRCYAMAVQCLLLIPILGIFLAEIGSLVLCTRGFQVAQELSLPRALLVALVPAMISLSAMIFAL